MFSALGLKQKGYSEGGGSGRTNPVCLPALSWGLIKVSPDPGGCWVLESELAQLPDGLATPLAISN